MSKPKVGVIGGAGFIGSYCTRLFLANAHLVKVGVRDKSKHGNYIHLFSLPQSSANLDVVQVDVRQRDELANFMEGCDYLVHAGTPFQPDVRNPQDELFTPTIDGTRNLLAVMGQTETLKRVVFIASVSAYNTNFPFPPEGKQPLDLITEQDKPYYSSDSSPYAQAKFRANQVVREFIREQPHAGIDLVTLSPTSVMGKPLSHRDDSTTAGFQELIKQKKAPDPFFEMLYAIDPYFAMVGVEDLARSIYAATHLEGNHGLNMLISSESYRISDVHLLLNGQDAIHEPVMTYSNHLAQSHLNLVFDPIKHVLRGIDN